MKKSEEYSTARESEHVKYMVENTPKREKINRPISAAQALYENSKKDPKAYEAYLNRPMVTKEQAQILDSKGNIDPGGRTFTPEEVAVELKRRKSSKNTLGDVWDIAAYELENERRDRAVSAFTCSPPAEPKKEELEKIVKMTGYTPPVIITKTEDSIWNKFKKLFKAKKATPTQGAEHEVDLNSEAVFLYKTLGGKPEDFKK